MSLYEQATNLLYDVPEDQMVTVIQFIVSCIPEKKKEPENRRRIGILAHENAWISDDFNDPLPEFMEYMA